MKATVRKLCCLYTEISHLDSLEASSLRGHRGVDFLLGCCGLPPASITSSLALDEGGFEVCALPYQASFAVTTNLF